MLSQLFFRSVSVVRSDGKVTHLHFSESLNFHQAAVCRNLSHFVVKTNTFFSKEHKSTDNCHEEATRFLGGTKGIFKYYLD
jgi:hypothetical protein